MLNLRSRYAIWLIALTLWLSYALMASSAVRKSPTVDEQSHLFRGIAYLKSGATHFLLGHPLLANTLAALPLLTEPDLRLPVDQPYWDEGNWSLAGDAFLWRVNNNPHRLILLGRLPIIWLTMFLGALLFRWGRELAGSEVGLLAAVILLFDPNVIAHGRLVTTDLPLTLFFCLTIYAYWHWTRKPGPKNILAVGMALGLAITSKYSGLLLLPTLGLLGLTTAWRRRSWQPLLALLWIGLCAAAVVWIVYAFAIRPLPGGAYWKDLFWVMEYFNKQHGAYLLGQYSADGWWYYFPIAFILKTPLPTLLLLVMAFLAFVRQKWMERMNVRVSAPPGDFFFLLVPVAVYLIASLGSALNIGYRHLLPILPFIFLISLLLLSRVSVKTGILTPTIMAAWLIFVTITIWPDYIPFMNPLAGSPDNRWRLLSDSNVDWGQDLPALAQWQQQRQEPVMLSYFGTAHPSAYGIDFDLLPTWVPAPEQQDPARQSFDPLDPAPGWYAISVTNLHGIVLGEERNAFAWFRPRTPVMRLGGSIFIYEVLAHGQMADVAFSGLRPAELEPELRAQLQTNDLRPRWFDAGNSFIWPADGGWVVLPANQPVEPALRSFWPVQPVVSTASQSLYKLAPPQWSWDFPEVDLDGKVAFLGYQRFAATPDQIDLLTAWRVLQPTDRPLKIFVHALDNEDQIVGQWDGLSMDPAYWLPGDVLVQFHSFGISQPLEQRPDEVVRLATGMYDGETEVRLSNRIILED